MSDWNAFFKKPFVLNEKAYAANVKLREAAKWFLEFLRNMVVVAFIFLIAEKSGRWYIYALATLAGLALWVSVYSHIDRYGLNIPPQQTQLRYFLAFLAPALVASAIVIALQISMN